MSSRSTPQRLVLFTGLALSMALSSCDESSEKGGSDSSAKPKSAKLDPRASLDAELARLMTAFGQEVKGVHDQATWDLAKPRIESLLEEIPRIAAKLRNLPTPTGKDYTFYFKKTQQREAALEKTLGDKDAFLAKLPPEVSAQLTDLAGRFYNVMGDAQNALRGPAPPPPGVPAVPSGPKP